MPLDSKVVPRQQRREPGGPEPCQNRGTGIGAHIYMSRLTPLLVVGLTFGMARTMAPAAGADLDSLVAAERAFARASKDKGIREAFLEYLADDSIVFRPRAVSGRKWYQDRPESGGHLSWEPAFAEISRGGDLGYTTGPWSFRAKDAPE